MSDNEFFHYYDPFTNNKTLCGIHLYSAVPDTHLLTVVPKYVTCPDCISKMTRKRGFFTVMEDGTIKDGVQHE